MKIDKARINTKATYHVQLSNKGLKTICDELDIQFQLFPLHMNTRNSEEWVVRTFNNHFISAL